MSSLPEIRWGYNGYASLVDIRELGFKDLYIGYHGRGQNPRKRYPWIFLPDPTSPHFPLTCRGRARPYAGRPGHMRLSMWDSNGMRLYLDLPADLARAEELLIKLAEELL